MMEVMILDTPDAGICLSYVNGMYTMDGGVHVNESYAAIGKEIVEMIHNVHKSKKDKENRAIRLTVEDISKHISIIINCRLPDPKYTSQSKTRLAGPKPHIVIPEKCIDIIKNWNLVNRLIVALEAKMHVALKKSNGGRVKHISLDAGEDANEAGTDKSENCVLYLVEGKSAAAYPKKRIVMSEGGKDFGGYYPLRGKFLNVRNASILEIAENGHQQFLLLLRAEWREHNVEI
jgi:DNA topoisomerase-2